MTARATPAARRRSQGERSAATRERLLDATIECLIDRGYVGTTTTEIVRRAGVSRGAQVHHFPTKVELVQNAVVHLAQRRLKELKRDFARVHANGDGVSVAIDLLWSAYAGPLFAAALELIVAARTDPELRPALKLLQKDISAGVEALCRETFGPEALRRRSFVDAIQLTAEMMHGHALSRLLDGKRGHENRLLDVWKRAVRPMFEEALAEAERGKR